MDAVSEGQVRVVGPGDVETVRIDEAPPVSVGGGERYQDLVSGADLDVRQLDVLGGYPGHVAGDRLVAQHLLDGARDQGGVVAQPASWSCAVSRIVPTPAPMEVVT